MVRQRLTSRTLSDFGVLAASIPQYNYVRSLTGKINIGEVPATVSHNCLLSVTNKINADDSLSAAITNIRRGLTSKIDSSVLDIPSIAALRRRNLPLPPSGTLTILRSQNEEKFNGNTLVAGNTHLLLLTALGDFPTAPEIVFALYEPGGNLIVKSNLTTQADINIENITPATIANTQKLTAQIVLYPNDTNNISTNKVLLYKVEIVDVLADEVYTIELGKITVQPDILDYFAIRQT